jgi:putative transposase
LPFEQLPKSEACVLILEYKLRINQIQRAAIDEAIRTVQFIRNKCIRQWMDTRGTNDAALHRYCAELAHAYPFAARLNSMARQQAADRAWFSVARFYKHCREKKPGKKGYPRFQKENRSVAYKTSGWRLEPDGKRLTQHPRAWHWDLASDWQAGEHRNLPPAPDQAGPPRQAC